MYFIVSCMHLKNISVVWQLHFNTPTTFEHLQAFSEMTAAAAAEAAKAVEAEAANDVDDDNENASYTIAFVIPINHKKLV